MQIGLTAHAHQVATLGQLIRDRDGVSRLAAAEKVQDRVIDLLVRRAVEVDTLEHLDAVSDRVLGQQHAADDALLSMDVLGRKHAVARVVRDLATPRIRLDVQLRDRHARPFETDPATRLPTAHHSGLTDPTNGHQRPSPAQ